MSDKKEDEVPIEHVTNLGDTYYSYSDTEEWTKERVAYADKLLASELFAEAALFIWGPNPWKDLKKDPKNEA